MAPYFFRLNTYYRKKNIFNVSVRPQYFRIATKLVTYLSVSSFETDLKTRLLPQDFQLWCFNAKVLEIGSPLIFVGGIMIIVSFLAKNLPSFVWSLPIFGPEQLLRFVCCSKKIMGLFAVQKKLSAPTRLFVARFKCRNNRSLKVGYFFLCQRLAQISLSVQSIWSKKFLRVFAPKHKNTRKPSSTGLVIWHTLYETRGQPQTWKCRTKTSKNARFQ